MSAHPDLDRVGGLEWTRRSGGALTRSERMRLLARIAAAQVGNLAGRVKLATGRVPQELRRLDEESLMPPDSALAREAERACAQQPRAVAGHGHRTWVFGVALAAIDGQRLDRELFYVGALLHDAGIIETVAGEDFTLRSGDVAAACLHAAGRGEDEVALRDAITVHATPGISADHDGALGTYIQSGAMLDIAGLRKWDLSGALVDRAIDAHPRHDVNREIARLAKAEADACPEGRFALLVRSGLLLAVRMAPYPE
jgi:hypothetical protein